MRIINGAWKETEATRAMDIWMGTFAIMKFGMPLCMGNTIAAVFQSDINDKHLIITTEVLKESRYTV